MKTFLHCALRLPVLLGVCGLLLVAGCPRPDAPGTRVLLRLEPEAWALENFVLSDDATRFACVQRVGDGGPEDWHVFVDGRRLKQLGIIRSGDPEFSPDGRRFAYAVRVNGGVRVVVDGKAGPVYEDIGRGRLFSPDGRRVAYVVARWGKSMLVEDGREGPVYDAISSYVLGPAGERTAYVARRGESRHVVVDGQESPAYDGVLQNSLQFSPDGSSYAFAAVRGSGWLVVRDDSVFGPYRGATHLAFSPDGKRFAYAAWLDEGWRVFCDGVPGPAFRSPLTRLEFSPDSRRLAYGVELEDGDAAVVVDDTVGPRRVDLGRDSCVVFSPDSRRLAYFARIDPEHWALVVDDTVGPLQPGVGERPAFSPDSRRLAYWAKQGIEGQVIVDGVPDTVALVGIEQGIIRFSPDSRHYAYAGWRDQEWYVVLNGVPGQVQDYPLVCGTRLTFQPNGDLTHLARRGNEVQLVRVRPE